jgi:hypothetical protein
VTHKSTDQSGEGEGRHANKLLQAVNIITNLEIEDALAAIKWFYSISIAQNKLTEKTDENNKNPFH